MGKHYSDEEKRIASQNLPSKELHRQFIEAGYTDRSEGSIKAWRLNNGKCRPRNYKTRKTKQKKVSERKTGLRDALGCYEYAY